MNVSKLALGFGCVGLKLNFPPKTCIPNKAKMTINKKRSNSNDMIERNELSRDETRLRRDVQYLVTKNAII
jgi:hypothetical protein